MSDRDDEMTGLDQPPRGPGRPRKQMGEPAPAAPPAAQPQVIVVQHTPAPVAATEDLDETVDGGYFLDESGKPIDSFGHPIPDGAEKQDPAVMARHRLSASSLGSA